MPVPLFRALVVLVGSMTAAACLDESVTGTRALSFALEANATDVAVGATVRFTFTGEGTNVTAVVVEFGDGVADTLTYPPAVSVGDFTEHSYEAAGTYTATGTIIAQNGRLSDEVAVTVN